MGTTIELIQTEIDSAYLKAAIFNKNMQEVDISPKQYKKYNKKRKAWRQIALYLENTLLPQIKEL